MHRAHHLREDEPFTLPPHPVAVLRIGDAVVPAETFEARETDFFGSLFHPTKEGVKCEIHPHG